MFKEFILILYKFFQEREEEGILPSSFCEVSIAVTAKLGIDITRKLQPISYEYRCEHLSKNTSKLNPVAH